MDLNKILNDINKYDIEIIEKSLPGKLRGMYSDNVILINKNLLTTEKKCILAEELGHHFMNYGDVLDKKDINSIKQEIIARRWGHHYLIPLDTIQETISICDNIFQLAQELDVTEDFLKEAITHYQQKYGLVI